METNTRKERREAMSTEPSERAREWLVTHNLNLGVLPDVVNYRVRELADLLTRYASEREGQIRELIAKWRESHKTGWHESECCVSDLLDELEALDGAAQQKASEEQI